MIIIKKLKKQWKLYPIGSPKDALNNKRVPEYVGTFKFKDNGKSLSISKFIASYNSTNNEERLIPPQDVIKLLKSQAVFLATRDSKVESFLKSYNIKPRYTKVCKYCAYDGNITVINSDYSYKYHNQLICKDCAYETIKKELKLQGFDKKVFKNFKALLDKTEDLEKVISVLSPKFDPLSNSNLTLFDKVEVNRNYKIPKIAMKRLKIPTNFKDILISNGNSELLPVQYLAIKEGLLKGEDLLVVSATGSGKTLVGELPGIINAMKGKKFLFLTPLVALANQKYRDFKKKYSSLGLKVAIKVGRNRIKSKGILKIPDLDISSADIVVGTYEGIDYLIRSGNFKVLNELGLILIDEIHMINDEDRGSRLNGLIKRMKDLFPSSQIIGLSATVKNPKFLADKFDMKLVKYSQGPVPLERHLVYLRNESEKRNIIKKLVKKEYYNKSSKGFNGQSIIFTNSRRKTRQIANYLKDNRIKAESYHAGLSYNKKEKIERDFDKGKISAVVTTAALAAGVDFPASQVIFDSFLMGNKWISPNEFSQMVGRAGRPTYHDRGVVYLLPEIGNEFEGDFEEVKALELLESNNENVYIEYSEESAYEEILADISSKSINTTSKLNKFYENIDIPISLKTAINKMKELGLINYNSSNKLTVTKYGKAVSISFLSIEKAEFIRKSLENIKKSPSNKKGSKDISSKIQDIAMNLELFENAYLSNTLHNQISNSLKIRFSTRLFAESTLDIISSGEAIEKIDGKYKDALLAIQLDFLRCNCKDRPFCSCLQKAISELIISERLNSKDPVDISKKLFRSYQIQVYPGDIFSWLDNYLKNLDAVKRIAIAFNLKNISKETDKLIKKIEDG